MPMLKLPAAAAAAPQKRKRGMKGPKVPRQEDRKTGFGRDEKDDNPLAHLGVQVAKPAAQPAQTARATDSFSRALRALFLDDLDRKVLESKLVTDAEKLDALSENDLRDMGLLPLNRRRAREQEREYVAALRGLNMDDDDRKLLRAAAKPVTDAATLKAMTEDAFRKLGIRPAKERQKREKYRAREKVYSEALGALHLDDEDRRVLMSIEKPVTDAKKLSKLSEDDLGKIGIIPIDRRRARQRVREELVLLQRQLNNAAKEDNATGISQCVLLQKELDPEQLLAPPREGSLDLGVALCLAARRGNLEAVKALLEHGATTEYKSDDHSRRPLHLAVVNNKHQAARALIEAGADIHATSDSPGNDALAGVPLVLAVSKEATESVWELLRVDPCNKENTDPDGPVPVGKHLPPSNAHVKAFHMAVLRGDKQIVRKFIMAGMPIDVPDKRGWSAIHVACQNNHGDLVKTLAGAACKLNTAEGTSGMTPLVIAAKQGYVDIVTYLLHDVGVELDQADNHGVTALQSACSQGRYDIVSLLLEQGASTTRRTDKGDTALTTAVRANFQDIVSRLLHHPGVDAEHVNQFATAGPGQVLWSPMQLAAREGFMSVCEVLWKQGKADVNRQLRDEAGLTWTTLGIAASRNHLDVCKLLLRGRARVYPTNEDGRQAVWFAARDGYSAVTLALMEGGGNAAQADVDGLTPALAAALYGHADTIMKVLKWQVTERRELAEAEERQKLEKDDAGIEIDVYDEDGEDSDDSFDAALQHEQILKRSSAELEIMTVTPDDLLPGALGPSAFAGLGLVLRSAVLREDLDLLELALRLGADPESEDDQHRKCPGQWAVEQAVAHGRIDVLLRVARTGAMIFHRPPRRTPTEDRREMAAYKYAIHSRIRLDGEDVEQPFHNGRPGTLEDGILVRPGLAQEIDSIVDPISRTPLIYACELGNIRWVQDLLNRGADIHAVDVDGWNAIHCAAFRGNLQLLELLLPLAMKAGIDVNKLTNDGRTALDLAMDEWANNHHAVADTLCEHGAEMTIMTVRNAREHGLSRKRVTELERMEKLKAGALSSLMPLAAIQAAISITGLLWSSQSVYEVPWQLAHVTRAVFARSAALLALVLLYAFAIPALVQSAPDYQTASVLSQLGTVPIVCVLIGIQLLVVSRAMYVDPGSKGCRSMPATPESWKAGREIAALVIEGLQHISISFASEISWNPSSGIDAFSQTFSLTARRRWFGAPPFPAAIACVVGSLIAIAWLLLAGYLALTLRIMWDVDLRQALPMQLRADRGVIDTWSEGPCVLLLGTTAYLAVVAGLLRQLHCAPTAAPVEELGGGDKNAGAPRASLMPRLWDDAEGSVPPTMVTECWTSGSHIFRAELAILLLRESELETIRLAFLDSQLPVTCACAIVLYLRGMAIVAAVVYHITTSVLAPFFAQSRQATVQLSEIPGEPICTAQPGIRRSYKFDAVARLVKLLLAVVAVYGRDEASLTLIVSLCGNATLAALASSAWCRPTNHALLNSLWTGVYASAAWLAVVAWASYLVAAPDTWGTVGVLLVGWVAGGAKIANAYTAKTAGKTGELSQEQESWVVSDSAP